MLLLLFPQQDIPNYPCKSLQFLKERLNYSTKEPVMQLFYFLALFYY